MKPYFQSEEVYFDFYLLKRMRKKLHEKGLDCGADGKKQKTSELVNEPSNQWNT